MKISLLLLCLVVISVSCKKDTSNILLSVTEMEITPGLVTDELVIMPLVRMVDMKSHLVFVKTLCSIPMYGNLIYDKYRQVYYCFAYPQTELAQGNYMDIWQLGRTKFSVMILDKDLNVLGETLLPENVYASNHFFYSRRWSLY